MAPTPEIGVGMLGYALMGKAHANAYKKIPYMLNDPPAIPRLLGVTGRDAQKVADAARRFGWERAYTDWREMLDDERITLFDNGGPNNAHAEACIYAAQAGKHILCEKPLARNAEEARAMLDAVQKAGVRHAVGFNYRFVPAIRLAYQLIQAGRLGKLNHFRATYLHEGYLPLHGRPWNWRMDRAQSGSGALGDLGSHVLDLARFLVGEPSSVSALTRTFLPERTNPATGAPTPVTVDDAFAALLEFSNGATGVLEASRSAAGNLNRLQLEINGELGSLRFNVERPVELEVFFYDEPKETRGWKLVSVSERFHPWQENWWPHGHVIGWEHTFVHEIAHLLDCIVNTRDVAPLGATFEDGWRAALVSDAILQSAAERKQVDVNYG